MPTFAFTLFTTSSSGGIGNAGAGTITIVDDQNYQLYFDGIGPIKGTYQSVGKTLDGFSALVLAFEPGSHTGSLGTIELNSANLSEIQVPGLETGTEITAMTGQMDITVTFNNKPSAEYDGQVLG